MEKSDLEISGEWDIVSSIHTDDENMKINKTEVNDSSMKENEISIGGSKIQDTADQENAACNESSSSDIDIIDENLDDREEVSVSCVLPSSSLTISSSVEKACDTCSGESTILSSSSENVSPIPLQSEETKFKTEDAESVENSMQNENVNQSAWSWIICGRSLYDWSSLFLEYLQNLSGFQWSCLFGLTMCMYFCITINQTNIIALEEKGNVVSQLEQMIDELRNDNKQLKEQMLSEMKNDKLVSSFEHQIRELKKENSKLNHMLYDVVKVLEKQKDIQEKLLIKKDDDYQAPFKKEINKLKEHINMLKFDNEELQKQLVRMRYASYSQGTKHTNTKDKKECRKEKSEKNTHDEKETNMKNKNMFGADENEKENNEKKDFSNEQPLDLEQLKKWNELLDLVIKELGTFDKEVSYTHEKPSDLKSEKNKDWSWQDEFKGIIINLPHIHVSEVVKTYAKSYEKLFSKIYKSASSYFSDAQENVQSFFEQKNFNEEQDKNSERNIKMWNIVNDLGEKWAQMKKKILSSYQKFNFPPTKSSNSEIPNDLDTAQDDFITQNTATNDERIDKSQMMDFNDKYKKFKDEYEKEKWYFKRADLREKLRKDEEDSGSINWFLKKKKTNKNIENFSTDEDTIDDQNAEKEKKMY